MQQLVFTWPYALLFWAAVFWAFAPEFRIIARPQEPLDAPADANSKRLIMVAQPLAMIVAFAVAGAVPAAAMPNPVPLFWVGLCTLVAGSLLRRHCRRMLGENFTGAVIVKPGQQVVERGAYAYVRHPSYTAGAMLFCGMGFALANWISLLTVLASVAAVYAYRVRVEEAALLRVIGEPYERYMTRTKRFVPFLF